MGTAFVHTVIDDHSRIAYAEIHEDEKAVTAIGVLQRAVAWFAAREVTVERVLSDNGSAYRSHAWRDACTELAITPKRTRPYRPQTNGKIERFHRTLNDGWAYAKFYGSETARREALSAWIHEYNHHRPHTAIGNQPPISRLTNVAGQYSDSVQARSASYFWRSVNRSREMLILPAGAHTCAGVRTAICRSRPSLLTRDGRSIGPSASHRFTPASAPPPGWPPQSWLRMS